MILVFLVIAGRGDPEKRRNGDVYIGAHCPLCSHADYLRPEKNHRTLTALVSRLSSSASNFLFNTSTILAAAGGER